MTETDRLQALPKGWATAKVSEILQNEPLTGRKLKQRDYIEKGPIPVIDQGQKFIGGYTDKSDYRIETKTPVIVFGDHTKVIKYVDFTFVAGADGVKVLVPSEIFLPRLLYYFLKALKLPDKGYARHFQYLEKSLIPIPPIAEQYRIATKVEELFSFLDAGIDSLRKVQAQLKRYRQAVLNAAINGNLTKKWRENHKDVLISNIEFAKKVEAESESSDLAMLIKKGQKFVRHTANFEKLPKGWVNVPLIKAATLHRGYDLPEHERTIGPFPVVASSSVVGFHKKAKVKGPGVVTGRSGTIGVVRYIESDFWPLNTALYVCDFHGNNPKFISLLLESMQLNKFLTGTGVPTLNRNNIHPIEVPLPQQSEQLEIVSIAESLLSLGDQTALSISKSMAQSERLRQTVLLKAFKGNLSTQNPSDEPAQKLLERIKAQHLNNKKLEFYKKLETSQNVVK